MKHPNGKYRQTTVHLDKARSDRMDAIVACYGLSQSSILQAGFDLYYAAHQEEIEKFTEENAEIVTAVAEARAQLQAARDRARARKAQAVAQ